jgi:two-component system NarL family sensor kinase
MDAYEATIYNAIIITVMVLGCIIIYFGVSVFRTQRKHIEIQRKNFLNEANLLEKERTRIARDLHDELGPLLSITRINLNNVPANTEQEARLLNKACNNINSLAERLGQIATNLTPSSLIKKGLHFALKDFIMDVEDVVRKDRTKTEMLRFEFIYQVEAEISAETSIHIFRLVQEIVHNTIKHSKGDHLLIHLKQRRLKLYLYCKDNGVGFPVKETLEKQKGIGLQSLQSRTGMLGGKMNVKSFSGEGTSYFFEIPLQQNE